MEQKELKEALKQLFISGEVKILVNIEPQHAEAGDGRWNVTKTYVIIGEDVIECEGFVELCEPK